MEVRVSKEACVSVGQYENIRVRIELARDTDDTTNSAINVAEGLMATVDALLATEIDKIDGVKRKTASRSTKFGL